MIADWKPNEIAIWASCQHPFLVQAEIADMFGLPIGAVRIQVPYLGGGFGSKSYTKMEPLTVALSRKARRPVKIVNRVDESMVTSRRHGMRCWMRTSADADGRLLARESRFWLDTGAYMDNGPRVTATGGRLRARPLPLAGGARSKPTASTATPRRRAPTAPSARPTSNGWASCRSTSWRARRASTRSRCAGATSCVQGNRSARTAPASPWMQI